MLVLIDEKTRETLYTFSILEEGKVQVKAHNKKCPSYIDWAIRGDGKHWFSYNIAGGRRRMAERKVMSLKNAMQYLTTFTKPYQTAKALDPDGNFMVLFMDCLPLVAKQHKFVAEIDTMIAGDRILEGVQSLMCADWDVEPKGSSVKPGSQDVPRIYTVFRVLGVDQYDVIDYVATVRTPNGEVTYTDEEGWHVVPRKFPYVHYTPPDWVIEFTKWYMQMIEDIVKFVNVSSMMDDICLVDREGARRMDFNTVVMEKTVDDRKAYLMGQSDMVRRTWWVKVGGQCDAG